MSATKIIPLNGNPNAHNTATAQKAPELPWFLKPEPAAASAASPYLDEYIQQASNASPMTPTAFHESAGLVLATTAIAGRIFTTAGWGPVYPNLYVAWIAPTSVCRKSTALDFMEDLANECFPHLMAPSQATPEALLANLGGELPPQYDREETPYDITQMLGQARDFAAQRTVCRDEIGGMIDSFGRDYNSGLKQVWLNLFDCRNTQRLTRKDGLTWVRNPCVSLIGASTHLALSAHLQDARLWEEGWWARFALLGAWPSKSPLVESSPSDTNRIKATINELYNKLPVPQWGQDRKPPVEAVMAGQAERDLWHHWASFCHDSLYDMEDARLHGMYSRLGTLLYKVSTILASVAWVEGDTTQPTIRLPHLHRAIKIVDSWRCNAHDLLAASSETVRSKLHGSIARQLSKSGHEGLTWTEIFRAHRTLDRNDVRSALQDMIEAEEVTQDDPYRSAREPDPNHRGRPKARYWLVVE